jgi:Protein of unknown function (DUF2877)
MSVAYPLDVRAVTVLRAGVVARELCRRGGTAEVAAVSERSFYLRIGEDFICVGEQAIGNGPTTVIVAARVAELGLRQDQRAFLSRECLTTGDLLFDLSECQTWHAMPWPKLSSPAVLHAACAEIARAATKSPRDSLAYAVFASADTPFARLARPRVAKFESWLSERIAQADDVGWAKRRPAFARCASYGGSRLSPPHGLIGLGPGLTPSGDDFLMGALAALDALEQTNMHAVLACAVVAAAGRTSPLSASLLRTAAAGHVGENLHTMVAAIVTGDAHGAIAAAARIGHTSGWDALAGAVMTISGDPSRTTLDDGSLTAA